MGPGRYQAHRSRLGCVRYTWRIGGGGGANCRRRHSLRACGWAAAAGCPVGYIGHARHSALGAALWWGVGGGGGLRGEGLCRQCSSVCVGHGFVTGAAWRLGPHAHSPHGVRTAGCPVLRRGARVLWLLCVAFWALCSLGLFYGPKIKKKDRERAILRLRLAAYMYKCKCIKN